MLIKSTICPILKFGLQTLAIWPDVPFATPRRLFQLFIMFFVQYFQYRYIYVICKRGDLMKIIGGIPATVYYSLTCFKIMAVWKYRRIVRELLIAVDTDWRECVKLDRHLHIMMAKANISRFCTHCLMTYNTVAGMIYFGGDILIDIIQMLQGQNSTRPFPTKVLLPFEAEQSPIYELVVLFLYLVSMSVVYTVNFLSSFVLTLVFHASGQIEIICQQLKFFSEEISYYGSWACATKMLIERHNKVISFSENIEKLFSYIALVQVFGNTIVICFLGLVLMISHTISLIPLLQIFFAYSGITVEIFLFCFVGEYLSVKSKSVGTAGYESLWYNISPSHSKNILFIILRSQKQLTLTAGGMADLSLEAFTSIMKASASYMSVLNAMY